MSSKRILFVIVFSIVLSLLIGPLHSDLASAAEVGDPCGCAGDLDEFGLCFNCDATSCGAGFICAGSGGYCHCELVEDDTPAEPDCTDECTTAGDKQCFQAVLKECKADWDSDTCLEWGGSLTVLETTNRGNCNDDIDNDCDGKVDDLDPDCGTASPCVPNWVAAGAPSAWGQCINGQQSRTITYSDSNCGLPNQIQEETMVCEEGISNQIVYVEDEDTGDTTPLAKPSTVQQLYNFVQTSGTGSDLATSFLNQDDKGKEETKAGIAAVLGLASTQGGLISDILGALGLGSGTGATDDYTVSTGEGDTKYGSTPTMPIADADEDGLSDAEEERLGTNPNNADTDEDGLPDKEEVNVGTNPLDDDSDDDGLKDGDEKVIWGNDWNADPDGDGLINILDPDSDDDGLLDGEEVNVHGTDPLKVDTDGDGITDKDEITQGSDPLDINKVPCTVCANGDCVTKGVCSPGKKCVAVTPQFALNVDTPITGGAVISGFAAGGQGPENFGADNCADGIDNDDDGTKDCDEANEDCANAPNCIKEDNCADELDNNNNGLIDCNDPDCVNDLNCPGDVPLNEAGDAGLMQVFSCMCVPITTKPGTPPTNYLPYRGGGGGGGGGGSIISKVVRHSANSFSATVSPRSGSSGAEPVYLEGKNAGVELSITPPPEPVNIEMHEDISLPADISAPNRKALSYIEVSVNKPHKVNYANIAFILPASVADESVMLKRYVDGEWVDLTTKQTSAQAGKVAYVANSPGLSYFAITVQSGLAWWMWLGIGLGGTTIALALIIFLIAKRRK